MFQLTYINYLILLFIVSGIVVLGIDTRTYKQEEQTREEKVSRVFGWLNITLGVVVGAGYWVLHLFWY